MTTINNLTCHFNSYRLEKSINTNVDLSNKLTSTKAKLKCSKQQLLAAALFLLKFVTLHQFANKRPENKQENSLESLKNSSIKR